MAEISAVDEGVEAQGRPRPFRALVAAFAAENDRRILWLPVLFGSGIALYFALTVEPPPWLGLAAAVPAVGGADCERDRAAAVCGRRNRAAYRFAFELARCG